MPTSGLFGAGHATHPALSVVRHAAHHESLLLCAGQHALEHPAPLAAAGLGHVHLKAEQEGVRQVGRHLLGARDGRAHPHVQTALRARMLKSREKDWWTGSCFVYVCPAARLTVLALASTEVCKTALCRRSRSPTSTGFLKLTCACSHGQQGPARQGPTAAALQGGRASSTSLKRGLVPANMKAVANASSYALLQGMRVPISAWQLHTRVAGAPAAVLHLPGLARLAGSCCRARCTRA